MDMVCLYERGGGKERTVSSSLLMFQAVIPTPHSIPCPLPLPGAPRRRQRIYTEQENKGLCGRSSCIR